MEWIEIKRDENGFVTEECLNEVKFSRQAENFILTLIKYNNNVNIEENYVICDGERKIKVSINIKEE